MTLDPIDLSPSWALLYDSSVSGSFTGSVQVQTGNSAIIRVGASVPAADAAGITLRSGELTSLSLDAADSEKLYGRTYRGTSRVVLS